MPGAFVAGAFVMPPFIYRVSPKEGTESSNLYLGYQSLQKILTGINVKLITSSFYGIQDAAEI